MKIIEGDEYKEFLRKKSTGHNGPEFRDSNLNEFEKAFKEKTEGKYQPTDSYGLDGQVAFAVDTWAYKNAKKGEVVAVKRVPKSQIKKKNKDKQGGLTIEESKGMPGDFKVINKLYADEKGNTIRQPHINIVAYRDAFVYKNDFYFISEYLALDFEDIDRKTAGPADIMNAFIQLCDGLGFIHGKGLLHRDLHPGNIRCEEDEASKKIIPKILDFGLARGLESDTGDKEIGSPTHRAPDFEYNKASDTYSLSTLLFQILTGDTLESKCNEFCEGNQEVIDDLAKIQISKINGYLIDSDEKEIDIKLEVDRKTAERKVKLKYFSKKIPAINNRYLAAIIQKGIQPNQNKRYQSASEMKLDLEVAKRSDDLERVLNLYRDFNKAESGRIAKGEAFDLGKLEHACRQKDALYEELNKELNKEFKLSEPEQKSHLQKSHLWAVFEQQMILNDALAGVWAGVRSYAEQLGFKKQPGITDVVQHYTQVKQKLFSSYNDPKQRDKVTAFAGQVVQLCNECGDSPNY